MDAATQPQYRAVVGGEARGAVVSGEAEGPMTDTADGGGSNSTPAESGTPGPQGASAGAQAPPAKAQGASDKAPAAGNNGSAQPAQGGVVALALQAGWTMGVLFGHLQEQASVTNQLPSENEMGADARIDVELTRLGCLLGKIAKLFPDGAPLPDCQYLRNAAPPKKPKENLNEALETFHVALMGALACISREAQLGYELGRSLRDTVNPPPADDGLADRITARLGRRRVSTLQTWLRTVTSDLPSDSATIVSASLGKWSEYVAVVLGTSSKPSREDVGRLSDYLLHQGDTWMNLLTGTEKTDGLLTPEGYVSAAEAAISRAARLVGKVLRHYWPVLLALAATLAAVLVLSAVYLPGGAGKVWTQMASIVASLGVSAKGIGSTLARLTREGAKPVYAVEEEEAKAWAVTSLPRISIGARDKARLRRAGVARPRSLGRP